MVHFPFYRKSRIMKPIKVLELSEVDRLKLEKGYPSEIRRERFTTHHL